MRTGKPAAVDEDHAASEVVSEGGDDIGGAEVGDRGLGGVAQEKRFPRVYHT